MGKLSDKPLKVDFNTTPTVTLVIDPSVELVEKEGRSGPYDMMPCKTVDGKDRLLGVGSARLAAKLQELDGPHMVEITRKGTGMDTTYDLKVLK